MSLNEEKAKFIANQMNLENGVIVNSGTIAILSALKLSGIMINDKVLINGYCCYSLYEAIRMVGATPIIVVPKDFYSLDISEISEVIDKYDINCVIAAHQYGIVQNVKMIREKYPNIKIIEDIAQAWNLINAGEKVGSYSDYVVTSFGETKPLSYGQAGAVFSNNDLHNYFDFHDRESRNSKNILLPFALYDCESIDQKLLVSNANEIVKKQRTVSEYLIQYFSNNPNVTIHVDKDGDKSCYQRFPIIINNNDYSEELESILNECGILYQWQNEKEIFELDMVTNYDTPIIMNGEKHKYLLVRTRQNDIDNVKKLVRR